MNKKDLINKTYKKHLKILKNLSLPQKKLIICFSGIPGSGKSYISKILEKRYKGIRIRNDKDIRGIMKSLDKNADLDKDVDNYLMWFLSSYSFPNKLIILDSGIDRRYKKLFSFAEENNYKLFTIRLKASRKILEKRIFEKNNCRDPHFDNEIKRWTKEWKAFGKKIKADIIIDNEKNNKLNLKPLFKKLDKLIKSPN